MSYWPQIFIKGDFLDLSHLEPFDFEVVPVGFKVAAQISVKFHDHCFTETFDPKRHEHPIRTRHGASMESRAFSITRYQLSKQLPEIILRLGGKRVASTREGNLVTIELSDGTIYPVFFTLKRQNALRANLYVVSAYPWERDGKPVTTGEMRFNLVVAKILRGERLSFPRGRF
jgi:hypothetical protein